MDISKENTLKIINEISSKRIDIRKCIVVFGKRDLSTGGSIPARERHQDASVAAGFCRNRGNVREFARRGPLGQHSRQL